MEGPGSISEPFSTFLEVSAPVRVTGHREAGFELGLRIDDENQGLRGVAAAFALVGIGLMAPVFAFGAGAGGGFGGGAHGDGWVDSTRKKPPLEQEIKERSHGPAIVGVASEV